jgi:hypothetical protein
MPCGILHPLRIDQASRQLRHANADKTVYIDGGLSIAHIGRSRVCPQLIVPMVGRDGELQIKIRIEAVIGRRHVETVAAIAYQFADDACQRGVLSV